MIRKTGERMVPTEVNSSEEYLIYLRHKFAYDYAVRMIHTGASILEGGSGEGYGTNSIAINSKAEKVVGLDVDKETIDYSISAYKNKNLEFILYDGIKIPFKDGSFDCVVSFQVVEHVLDDSNYIREIYRVLKKNGLFILSTPNRVYRLNPGEKPWNRFHIREYDEKTLRKLLSVKFKDIKISGLKGTKEIQDIEFNRVKKIRKFMAIDPIGLRNLLPEKLKLLITKGFNKNNFETNQKNNFTELYSDGDHYLSKSGLDESLDLIALCRK